MKKIFGFLLSLIVLLSFATSVDAASYSSTITAKKSSTQQEYIDGLPIYYNKAGSVNLYVLDADTYYDTSTTLRNPEELTGGFSYIISNSNPTSNSSKNYYITQVAILWYEDYLNGNDNNISYTLKNYITSNTSSNTICYYINKLVKNAKNYNQSNNYIELEDKNIKFTKSGNYYYSNDIEFTTNDLSSNPTIKLLNAPSGVTITNKSLDKDGNNSFQIRLTTSAYNSIDDDEEFEVSITGSNSDNVVYAYSNNYSEDAIYGKTYASNDDDVEVILPITISGGDDTRVRIKVLDEDGDYIKNIRYYVYEGNCKNNTCDSDDLIHSFTTTSSYTTINNILNEGTYTFVRKTTNSNYDLAEKELIEVEDITSIQTFTFESSENNDDSEYSYINIHNSLNDSSNVIKIYKTNGNLVDSYRANNEDYKVKLFDGYYYIIDSENLVKVYFKITDGELFVKEDGTYIEKNSINLDDYIDDKYIDNEDTSDEDEENKNVDKEDIYTDEDGNIHIDNLDGVDSIDISNDVETTTDVKIDWISNIIDCPPTSLSSTIKYIIGASVLAVGIFLTIRNVKKSKNNI